MSKQQVLGLDEEAVDVDEHKAADIQSSDEDEAMLSIERQEFDCPLCFQLLYDPLTLECGHSFCRDCVVQAFQLKRCCPVCRHHSTVDVDDCASNILITNILEKYVHFRYQQRAIETQSVKKLRKSRYPIFLSPNPEFPSCCISLRIFEAKYRVMVNRIMTNDSKFIMALMNHHHEVSQVPHSVATLCKIKNCQSFVDGRSHLQVIGVKRVKLTNIQPVNDSFGLLSAEIEDYLDIIHHPDSPSAVSSDATLENVGGSGSEQRSSEIRRETDNMDTAESASTMSSPNRFRRRHSEPMEPDGFWHFIAKLKVFIDANLNVQNREWLNNNEQKRDGDPSAGSTEDVQSDEELVAQIMHSVDQLAAQKRNGGNREMFYQRAGRPPTDCSQLAFWIAGTLPRWTYRSGASHVESQKLRAIQTQILESRTVSERLKLAQSLSSLCVQCSQKRSKVQFWIIVSIIAIAVLYELLNGS